MKYLMIRSFLLLVVCNAAWAQIELKSVAIHESLGEDVFAVGVYLDGDFNEQSAQDLHNEKRFEIRVLKPKILAGHFRRVLAESISINHDADVIAAHQDLIIDLTKSFKWNLQQGDHVVFAFQPHESLKVSINGNEIFRTKDLNLFSLIKPIFFGKRPLSESLKRDLLAAQLSPLVETFEAIKPAETRKDIGKVVKPENLSSQNTEIAKMEKAREEQKRRLAQARKDFKTKVGLEAKRLKLAMQECESLSTNELNLIEKITAIKARLADDRLSTRQPASLDLTSFPDISKQYAINRYQAALDRCRVQHQLDLVAAQAELEKRLNAKRTISGEVQLLSELSQPGILYIEGIPTKPSVEVSATYFRNRFKDSYVFLKPGDKFVLRNRDKLAHEFIAVDNDNNVVVDFGTVLPSGMITREVDWPAHTALKLKVRKGISMASYLVNIPSDNYKILAFDDDALTYPFEFNELPATANSAKFLIPGASPLNISLGPVPQRIASLTFETKKVADLNINTVWH